MARVFKPEATPSGASGVRYTEQEHEVISLDSEERRYANTVSLRGDAIGMGAEELLAFARARLVERAGLVDRLMRWVPRKYEERIKALDAPEAQAMDALRAVELLIANAKLAAAALEKPPER
jgi:hypothetical protein